MVYTLALGDDDRQTVLDELRKALENSDTAISAATRNAPRLSECFRDVLDLPGTAHRAFAETLDRVLDDLLAQDFFGTEGQNDPRGDHRDDD